MTMGQLQLHCRFTISIFLQRSQEVEQAGREMDSLPREGGQELPAPEGTAAECPRGQVQ